MVQQVSDTKNICVTIAGIMEMHGYTATIGLEIHVHLKTKTKMFSRSLNNPDEKTPNVNISPVDLAYPGTLPTINKKALEHMVRVGLAVNGTVANFTEFDRKNYFYPDIPKGYQISQYKYPVVSGGSVAGFDLTRIHLEEDTATSKHFGDHSLIDFNRAGAPLMELVTEPVLHTPQDVIHFARELQILLRYLGASDADIEKGQMRVEVNLSVSKDDTLGTKVEVKNIGSISAAGKAAEYEIQRQIEALEKGEILVQETRGWNDSTGTTFAQRSKENAKDYRYFPEPDLPKLYLHELFDLEAIKASLPELPQTKRARYQAQGIKDEDIEFFISNMQAADFLDVITGNLDQSEVLLAVNYISSDIAGLIAQGSATPGIYQTLNSEYFVKLIKMIKANELNSRGAKDILAMMIQNNEDPQALAEHHGLIQDNNPEKLLAIVEGVVAMFPEQVAEYRSGKEALIKFFVGQAMKETKGSGNPEILTELFEKVLKA